MRTKVLLVTAALGVACVSTTIAQVYSANAVGYVNISLPAGLSIIANPLNGVDNNLNTILPLPDSASGTVVYRFDTATQNYGNAQTFVGFGLGWQGDDLVLDPGEGVFIQTLAPLDVTFVGEVPQGDLQNPVPGANNLSIRSSQVPQEAPLGHKADNNGPTTGLEFPAVNGDTIYLFDQGSQAFGNPWQYVDIGIPGFGWTQGGGFSDGPTIPVGTGFFVQKAGPLDQSWDRSFSVN